jgi:hypothetical protein
MVQSLAALGEMLGRSCPLGPHLSTVLLLPTPKSVLNSGEVALFANLIATGQLLKGANSSHSYG